MKIPNLAIFRYLDDKDGKCFVQVDLVKGKPVGEGIIFGIESSDDSYDQMEFKHIVIAQKTTGGSIDLCRFEIVMTDTKEPVVVHSLSDISVTIEGVYNLYMESQLC